MGTRDRNKTSCRIFSCLPISFSVLLGKNNRNFIDNVACWGYIKVIYARGKRGDAGVMTCGHNIGVKLGYRIIHDL